MVLFAFIFSDPYFVITFLVLILVLISLQGVSSELKNIMKFFIPLSILIIILNPLLNRTGAHKIYIAQNFFITYEAIAYGVLMSLALLIVILVFSSYNRSVSYQEMLYIFSKKLPIISMIIVMALRFIPLINSRAIEVQKLNNLKANGVESNMDEVDGSLGENEDLTDNKDTNGINGTNDNNVDDFSINGTDDNNDNNGINLEEFDSNISSLDIGSDSRIFNKIKSSKRFQSIAHEAKVLGKIMGITVSWSLEESMFTAKSMKARGYSSHERTSYLSYEFGLADIIFLAIILITVSIIIAGLIQGYGIINIYPSIDFSFSDLPFNIYYLAFIVFLLPLIYLEIKERLLWH
ncbi:MAG: cobalt ABC transporter permease [Methanobrevibacter sp.]|nr:cobalt ABC transporter permease [Methanobrevibacter sp.]